MSLVIKDGTYKGCRVVETKVINYRVYCVVLNNNNTLVLVKEPNVVVASDEAVKKPTARKKSE